MTKTFLSIGECMIEMAPRADGSYSRGFAGDTFNTAWYARRIAGTGVDVAYLTAVGDDAPSEAMIGFMRDAGIRPIAARRSGRGVGLYMISLQDGERSFSYWRDTSAARTLADDLAGLPDLAPGDVVFFSGITLAILPAQGRARLFERMQEARNAGITVAFDPNLRPRLWASDQEMTATVMQAAAVADILLPSHEDEASFFGDAAPEATARRYQGQGAAMIVVKDGPEPVLIARGPERTHVTPDPVTRPVDTTAAGDSFNARFLVGLMQGETTEHAAGEAARLAGRVISAPGALVESATA